MVQQEGCGVVHVATWCRGVAWCSWCAVSWGWDAEAGEALGRVGCMVRGVAGRVQVGVRYLELVEELFANVRKLGQATTPQPEGPAEGKRGAPQEARGPS